VGRIGAPTREKEVFAMTDKTRSSSRTSGRSGYGKTSLIEEVTAQTQGYSRRQVAEIVDAALDTIKQKVASGQNVTLTGFGTFRRSQRAARMGTNIRTREKIRIPAQTSVRFTPGSEFKTAVGGRAGRR
jgi:nucleoid DNA-binding protein